MAIKDTHRFVRMGSDTLPQWEESDGHVSVEMELVDQKDSATVRLTARTLGVYCPEIRATSEIRITYKDLEVLVRRGQEILVEHRNRSQSA